MPCNLGIPSASSAERPTVTNTKRVAPREHVVLFYENDTELGRTAGGYLSEALLAGSVAVVIASEAHRAILENEIASAGLDLRELNESGSWITLDAAETIGRIVIDGRPDPAAFETEVGDLIVGTAEQGRSVCAYGEMVALLWDARQINAAFELEELWNDLGERTPFSLFCSYASSSLSDPSDVDDFEMVCSHHSAVVDPHAYEAELRPVRRAVRSFPATPESLTKARHFVAETALEWGFARLLQDAQLVVSELGGNAVRHARSEFSVVISASDSSIRLAVSDLSHAVPKEQRPAHDSSSGRGLMLVSALATDWGVEQSRSGKVVWADLQL
jgi:anti-sigma regulatory factor (Ser/Thr protein kinase)